LIDSAILLLYILSVVQSDTQMSHYATRNDERDRNSEVVTSRAGNQKIKNAVINRSMISKDDAKVGRCNAVAC